MSQEKHLRNLHLHSCRLSHNNNVDTYYNYRLPLLTVTIKLLATNKKDASTGYSSRRLFREEEVVVVVWVILSRDILIMVVEFVLSDNFIQFKLFNPIAHLS